MSYTQLQAHYVRQEHGGLNVGSVSVTVQLADGDTVVLPIPFLPINDQIGVAPVMEHGVNDGSTVRVDFSRWQPICLRDGDAGCVPLVAGDQGEAVRLARAFDADPATSWKDSPSGVEAWRQSYDAAQ